MNYRCKTTPAFRKSLSKLSPPQKEAAQRTFVLFKDDPFDAQLRTHKIHALSARFGRTIYSARVDDNLRAIFFLDGDIAISVDIGSHDIYR